MPYEVSTPVFDGPFDLLLHLITREEVDLYEISLSRIIDAYLAEMARLEHVDLDVATEFLLIAATLIELKTRRLLPGRDDVELDEEFAIWEERDLLLARLLECKTFKDAAQALSRISEAAERSMARRAGPDERFLALAPDVLAGVGPADIKAAFLRAVAPKPVPHVSLEHVTDIKTTVKDAIDELVDELGRAGTITFRALTSQLGERIEVIVRFLAVLELYKQGLIDLDQGETFGELHILWLGPSDGVVVDLTALTVEEYQG